MMGGYVGYADDRAFISLSIGAFGIKLCLATKRDSCGELGRIINSTARTKYRSTPTCLNDADLRDDLVLVEWLR